MSTASWRAGRTGILAPVTVTGVLLVAAGVVAVADWVAVDRHALTAERALKPLALALLVAAAATGDLGDPKPFVLVALVLGLVGDVAIMLAAPRGANPAFLAGLVAFLLGHVAWVIGFLVVGVHLLPLLAGLLVAAGVGGLVLPGVLRRLGSRALVLTVGGYSLAVGAMAGFAAGTQLLFVALGGVLFVVSDGVLARERFAEPLPRSPLIVAVTYHLAQFGLVIGLLFHATR